VEATPSSRGLWRFTTKPLGFLCCSTKPRPKAWWAETGSWCICKLRGRGHVAGSWACVGRTWTGAMAWPPNENIQVLTILPIRGMYHPLICRSRVVICLHRRDFIYIALGLNGNSSRLDYFSIPLLHRLDFSCFCIESHLCMYRRIRRCDDFPLQALCDFRVIFGAIFQDFHSSQDSSI
jgi:hypothetical protein